MSISKRAAYESIRPKTASMAAESRWRRACARLSAPRCSEKSGGCSSPEVRGYLDRLSSEAPPRARRAAEVDPDAAAGDLRVVAWRRRVAHKKTSGNTQAGRVAERARLSVRWARCFTTSVRQTPARDNGEVHLFGQTELAPRFRSGSAQARLRGRVTRAFTIDLAPCARVYYGRDRLAGGGLLVEWATVSTTCSISVARHQTKRPIR